MEREGHSCPLPLLEQSLFILSTDGAGQTNSGENPGLGLAQSNFYFFVPGRILASPQGGTWKRGEHGKRHEQKRTFSGFVMVDRDTYLLHLPCRSYAPLQKSALEAPVLIQPRIKFCLIRKTPSFSSDCTEPHPAWLLSHSPKDATSQSPVFG